MANSIRKDSYREKILHLMLYTSCVRLSDLYEFIRSSNTTDQLAFQIVSRLIKSGELIETSPPANIRSKTKDKFITLTPLGRQNILYHLKDPYLNKNWQRLSRVDKITSYNSYDKQMDENKISMIFTARDIPVFPHEKPSLSFLAEQQDINDDYLDSMLDQTSLSSLLDKGIYYTKKEVMDYLDRANVTNQKSDLIKGHSFKGLFISRSDCFVIYLADRKRNHLFQVNTKAEVNLCDIILPNMLRKISPMIYRPLSSKRRHGPAQIIFGNGESMVYSVAMANKSGRVHNNKDMSQTLSKKNLIANRQEALRTKNVHVILTAYSSLYDHLYVLPFNYKGMYMLYYLLTNTVESWQKESIEMVEGDERFTENRLSPEFPLFYKDKNCCVLQTYDTMLMCQFTQSEEPLAIITADDMLETINHSIRRNDVTYINLETLEEFSADEVTMYDYSGFPSGRKYIQDYLLSKNLTASEISLSSLPNRYGMKAPAFWNDVYNQTIPIDDVLPYLDIKDYKKPTRKQSYSKTHTVTLTSSKTKQLEEFCEIRQLSKADVIRKAINEYLEAHS